MVKGYDIPQTQTGILGSNNKIIPEYYHEYVNLKKDATLRMFNADGVLESLYKYDADVNKWIKQN